MVHDLSLYRYSDKELKELLSSMVILVDSREQQNQHILDYFEQKRIPYKTQKIDTGDYSCFIPANSEMGIVRDLHFPIVIERKNSVDELAQSIKDRSRFEAELIRSQQLNFTLLVEEMNGYAAILMGKYRSQYDPKALLASLKTFEARYGFGTVYLSANHTGHFIYHHLYYHVRHLLKGC